jgi:uncharacterized protein (DUF4415 family)
MSEKLTGKTSTAKETTDWEKLHTITDEEIRAAIESDPEIHSTDKSFWKDAKVVMPLRKEVVTMRLDADLLAWFRQEKGYQTRINAVLRAYMAAHGSLPRNE